MADYGKQNNNSSGSTIKRWWLGLSWPIGNRSPEMIRYHSRYPHRICFILIVFIEKEKRMIMIYRGYVDKKFNEYLLFSSSTSRDRLSTIYERSGNLIFNDLNGLFTEVSIRWIWWYVHNFFVAQDVKNRLISSWKIPCFPQRIVSWFWRLITPEIINRFSQGLSTICVDILVC